MRITGGEWCRRNLLVPKSDAIRPTQDMVRQALFNVLAPEIVGSTFLDLFAGSGAVGFEALSRGAKKVAFVESNRRHLDVLKKNAEALKVDLSRYEVFGSDAYKWIERYSGSGFTIGFADPPYKLGEEKGYADVLKTLAEKNVICCDGLFIAEMTSVQRAEETPNWDLLRDRTYGHTRICIWRRIG